ncbi:cytochrome C oxidase subunit IV family protein [Agrobacterium sp.]|uniref:cytochrome C oxidase subunit IV family protein n=1 Tax=Agrobacterium sp. TaxID=361 RepID=UPI0028AFA47A|nr:cytochrome C oxidase subunit IV family protein [Agrobacterium sp.]
MLDRTSSQLRKTFVILCILVLTGMAVVTVRQAGYMPALAAACLVLLFALLKSRRIIDDFLGLGGEPGLLRNALLAWPALFAAAALLRAVLQGIYHL